MRWIVGLLSLLLMLVLLVVGALALIPSDRVAQVAADQFRRVMGRELVIEGAVRPTFWPTLGVRTGPVSIANADWSEAGPMLRAEGLSIDLDMAALLSGEVVITGLSADRPQLLLEKARDGRVNWVFGGGNGGTVTTDTPGAGQPFTLQRGVVSGGSFRFLDHAAGRDITLDALELEAAIPDFTGPASLRGQAVVSGQPVSLTADIGVFAAFAAGRVAPLVARATVGGSTLSFDGRAGLAPLVAEGRLDAGLTDLAALAALAGTTAPALPQGLGAGGVSLQGALTLTADGTAYLRGATLAADGNTLTGDLDLAPGEARPRLTARLTAGDLSLAGLSGGQGGGAGGGAQADGWPQDRIDVSGLGAMDAEVALTATSVDLGLARLGAVGVKLTLDRARAVFDIRQMAAYGGGISGQFVVNGRGGLSVGGDLRLAGLQMQPLLQDLGGYDRLISTGDLSLRFLGVGNSVAEIMAGLKGEGGLSLGKGELRGLDIAGMLRTLDPGFVGEGQKTIFDGVTASFSIAGGVLSNTDLRLAAPFVTATGAGEVGLGARTLDYRLRPTALAAADGTGGVMVPLLITGTWAAPKFRLDLESIAREKMEAEAKALEARARERAAQLEAEAKAAAEAKLREELGVEAAPGESLEDAAKRRAQEVLDAEAKKLLDGLLGGN